MKELHSNIASYGFGGVLLWPLIVGVAVAAFSVGLAEYLHSHRHSNLRFLRVRRDVQGARGEQFTVVPDENGQPQILRVDPTPIVIWRLEIQNLKVHPARTCTSELREIYDAGVLRPNVVVAPLNWMHHPNGFELDISYSQIAYLDLCQVLQGAGGVFRFSNSPVMNLPDSSEIRTSPTKAEITLYQESGQRVDITLSIDFQEASRDNAEVRVVALTRFFPLFGLDWKRRDFHLLPRPIKRVRARTVGMRFTS